MPESTILVFQSACKYLLCKENDFSSYSPADASLGVMGLIVALEFNTYHDTFTWVLSSAEEIAENEHKEPLYKSIWCRYLHRHTKLHGITEFP